MPATLSNLSAEKSRDLAVAAMNRGHALMQAGDLTSALTAYEEAVALLDELPVAENPSWANSLGAALMNHGHLLHRAHGTARAGDALASLDRAIAVLRELPSADNPWPRRNLAGSRLNRASLLLDLARPAEARADTLAALQLAAPHERTDLIDADLALKIRRALCDAIGQLLVAPGADQDALASEASEFIDDGLALARFWTGRGAPQPRELVLRLFRFGAQLYRLYQPHFLAEFIEENLAAGTPEFHAIAIREIDLALQTRPDEPYLFVGDPASERRQQTWRDLQAVRARLAAAAGDPTLSTPPSIAMPQA